MPATPPQTTPPLIRNAEARRLFLAVQGLASPPRRRLDHAGLQQMIDDLGFVQVDSINAVERAHHTILFARNQTYRQRQLTRLLEREASLFENWTHDASIIPARFYPYWQPRFERERQRLLERWRKWRRHGFEDTIDSVLGQIRAQGPMMARQLSDSASNGDGARRKSGDGWWDWHPAKTALEYLWRTGELAVARREGFQKVYDLSERVIPPEHRAHVPEHEDFVAWKCAQALDRLVMATPGELAAFWGGIRPDEAKVWCAAAHAAGELVEVAIEPADDAPPRRAFARPDIFERLKALPEPPERLRALSPFDPLLRDRKRAQRLFDFDYRIEIYVPEAKRKYGYYVFPLLEGARLIGRLDMKHHRQDGELRVTGLWLEPKVKLTRGRRARLEAELERQRRFTGAERVVFADGWIKAV